MKLASPSTSRAMSVTVAPGGKGFQRENHLPAILVLRLSSFRPAPAQRQAVVRGNVGKPRCSVPSQPRPEITTMKPNYSAKTPAQNTDSGSTVCKPNLTAKRLSPTRLGYTYDWGNLQRGGSKRIRYRRPTTATVRSVAGTSDYCQ